jgi:hypothetical protein
MRTVIALAVQLVLWLFLWTSVVTLFAMIDRIADPDRRGNWIRVLGVATLALSLLIVLWLMV